MIFKRNTGTKIEITYYTNKDFKERNFWDNIN